VCFAFSDDAQNNPAGGVHFAAAAAASQKATLLHSISARAHFCT
jgi:hypothetical protein